MSFLAGLQKGPNSEGALNPFLELILTRFGAKLGGAGKNIVFALRAGWLQDVAQGARVKKLTNVSFWFGKSL